VVLSVRNLYYFVQKCRKPQICFIQNLTLLALLLTKKKIWGITFWANYIRKRLFDVSVDVVRRLKKTLGTHASGLDGNAGMWRDPDMTCVVRDWSD
jgi:hypothetical protein